MMCGTKGPCVPGTRWPALCLPLPPAGRGLGPAELRSAANRRRVLSSSRPVPSAGPAPATSGPPCCVGDGWPSAARCVRSCVCARTRGRTDRCVLFACVRAFKILCAFPVRVNRSTWEQAGTCVIGRVDTARGAACSLLSELRVWREGVEGWGPQPPACFQKGERSPGGARGHTAVTWPRLRAWQGRGSCCEANGSVPRSSGCTRGWGRLPRVCPRPPAPVAAGAPTVRDACP